MTDAPPDAAPTASAEQTKDWAALLVLTLIPALRLGLPALGGRAILLGDNLFQNFPLKLLAGRLLREGQLPLWNAQIWSGTALLGGFNAGALYPGTLLFAFLSPTTAWALNAISAYAGAAAGMYLLLRAHRLLPLAAFLGAATGTFGGVMIGQYVHLPLIQGMSFAPWILLALEKLASQREGRFGYWLLMCSAAGLVCLSGEPRAVSNVAVLAAIYFVGLWRRAPLLRQLLVATGAALPVAFALGAVQLLPGLAFVHSSQRGEVDLGFFNGRASLEFVPRLIEPFYRVLHTTWTFPYWDTEVWCYVGLLPIIAALTYPLWARKAPGVPRVPGMPGVWLAVALAGLVLTLAPLTSLSWLLHQIPFYGAQRGQVRNLALVDFGLAGLFACWVQAWLTGPGPAVTGRPSRQWLRWGLTLIPSAALLAIAWIVHEVSSDHFLFLNIPRRSYSIPLTLLSAIGGPLFLWFLESRRTSAARAIALVAFVTADLGFAASRFNADWSSHPVDALLAPSETIEAVRQNLGDYGRFANYDLEMTAHDVPSAQLIADLFVPLGLHSVQGLGSTVDRRYNQATGAHLWRGFDLKPLETDIADDLNLRMLLIPKATYEDEGFKRRKLHAALSPPHWQLGPELEHFQSFLNTEAKGRAWIEPSEQGPSPLGSVAVESVDPQDGEIDRVSTDGPALLVRSVAYGDGWTASLDRPGTPRVNLPVVRRRSVQAVELPGGAMNVTWTYAPPEAIWGARLSLLAAIGLGCLGLALAVGRQQLARLAQGHRAMESAHVG